MVITVKPAKQKVWTCPKCRRQFRTIRASHSCAYYPVSRHLANKSPQVRRLYTEFVRRLRLQLDFTVDSLPCCIHLVRHVNTFAGVYVLKDRLRLHIVLPSMPPNFKVKAGARLSAKRYLYSLDIMDDKEMDADLFSLIRQSAKMSD